MSSKYSDFYKAMYSRMLAVQETELFSVNQIRRKHWKISTADNLKYEINVA